MRLLALILLLTACKPTSPSPRASSPRESSPRASSPRAPSPRAPSIDEPGAIMLDPTRVDIMQPAAIVARVAPRATDTVVDFGAGPGAFTHAFARAVPQGRAIAVDVNAAYLARLRQDADAAHELNVETKAIRVGETGLPPASADVIFLCQVDHYFADPRAMLDQLSHALRPGGRIVIVNYLRSEKSIDGIAAALGWQRLDAWTPAEGFFARSFSPTSS